MDNGESNWLDDTLPSNNPQSDNKTMDDISNSETNIKEDKINIDNDQENIVNTSINNKIEDNKIEDNEIEDNENKMPLTLNDAIGKIEVEQSDEETFLQEYIGKNYENIMNKFFNFSAFIFTSLYMFYRKLYLLGLITLLLQFVLIMYVSPYAILAINLLSGLFVNLIYEAHCKRKIERIKNISGSKLTQSIANVCSEKGGTNKFIVILCLICHIAIIMIYIYQHSDSNKYFEQISSYIDEGVEEIQSLVD